MIAVAIITISGSASRALVDGHRFPPIRSTELAVSELLLLWTIQERDELMTRAEVLLCARLGTQRFIAGKIIFGFSDGCQI